MSEENGVDKQETKDSEDDNSGPVLVARDLAKALVQIQKGLEDKFLLPPFGKNDVMNVHMYLINVFHYITFVKNTEDIIISLQALFTHNLEIFNIARH